MSKSSSDSPRSNPEARRWSSVVQPILWSWAPSVLAIYYIIVAGLAIWYGLFQNIYGFLHLDTSRDLGAELLLDMFARRETALLWIVIASGAIGSCVHGATSLADYVGNRQFDRSWFLYFIFRPLVGALLAVVVYFVLRLGLVQPNGNAAGLNPFAAAALATLSGMFSRQAVDKLREVFDSLFRSSINEERRDKLIDTEIVIDGVSPRSLIAASQGAKIFVEGKNLSQIRSASIKGEPRSIYFDDETDRLAIDLLPGDLSAAGILEISIHYNEKERWIRRSFNVEVLAHQ